MTLDKIIDKKQQLKLSTSPSSYLSYRSLDKRHQQLVKACLITLSKQDHLIIKKALIAHLHVEGFRLIFPPQELTSKALRFQLHLHSLWYKDIQLYVPDMQIDLEGTVVNAQYLKNRKFEVQVAFSPNTPQYWRECLLELWPKK